MKGLLLNFISCCLMVNCFVVSAEELIDEPLRATARSAPNANIEQMQSFCFQRGDREKLLHNEEDYPRLAKFPDVLQVLEDSIIERVKALNYQFVENGNCDFYIGYDPDAAKSAVLLQDPEGGPNADRDFNSIATRAQLFSSSEITFFARKKDTDRTIWKGTVKEQIFDVKNAAETREELVRRCKELAVLLIDERFPPREF